MSLFASLVALFFVGLIVGGVLVHLYLYRRGALLGGSVKQAKERRLSSASFSQTGTVPIPASVADLYYGGFGAPVDEMCRYSRMMILYILMILVMLFVLVVLVLGATHF